MFCNLLTINYMEKIYARKQDGSPATYCSEFMEFIPAGIVDKKLTGCGLSTVALENSEPTILTVPTIQLIKNKVEQYPNSRFDQALFGFYYGQNNAELLKLYADQNQYPKILVTYDSLPKVVDALGVNYKVVVDEFSEFLDAYSYRDKAINKCREYLKDFDNVSYISATPIEPKYLPDEMADLTYTEIIWENAEKVLPYRIDSDDPYTTIVGIIDNYIENQAYKISVGNDIFETDTIYFFLNSVTDIAAILNYRQFDRDLVKVICADRERNHRKLRGYYTGTAPLSPSDERPINFVTSCAFKGVDFYSPNGLAVVVSNTEHPTTLVSIDTDIKQIIGRIRNQDNPHKNKVIHIHNQLYSLMRQNAKEKLQRRIAEKTNLSHSYISLYKKSTDEEKQAINKAIEKLHGETYLYFDPEKQEYVHDNLAQKNELRKFEVWQTYTSGYSILKEYQANGMDPILGKHKVNNEKKVILPEVEDLEFRELCIWYQQYQTNAFSITPMDTGDAKNTPGKLRIEREFPLVREAFEELGFDEIHRLDYDERDILFVLRNKKVMAAIKSEVRRMFNLDKPYPTKEVKNTMLAAYAKYGVHKTPLGKDLRLFFDNDYQVNFTSFREYDNTKCWVIRKRDCSSF